MGQQGFQLPHGLQTLKDEGLTTALFARGNSLKPLEHPKGLGELSHNTGIQSVKGPVPWTCAIQLVLTGLFECWQVCNDLLPNP